MKPRTLVLAAGLALSGQQACTAEFPGYSLAPDSGQSDGGPDAIVGARDAAFGVIDGGNAPDYGMPEDGSIEYDMDPADAGVDATPFPDATPISDMFTQQDMGEVEDPDMGEVEEPDMAVADPDMAVADPDMAVEEPDMAVADPDMAVEEPDMAVEEPDMAVEDPDMDVPQVLSAATLTSVRGALDGQIDVYCNGQLRRAREDDMIASGIPDFRNCAGLIPNGVTAEITLSGNSCATVEFCQASTGNPGLNVPNGDLVNLDPADVCAYQSEAVHTVMATEGDKAFRVRFSDCN